MPGFISLSNPVQKGKIHVFQGLLRFPMSDLVATSGYFMGTSSAYPSYDLEEIPWSMGNYYVKRLS